MNDLADKSVFVTLFEKVLPVLHTLKTFERTICVMKEELTFISASSSPRRSCVRCSLKQPVPNDRAASTPALETVSQRLKNHHVCLSHIRE